MSKDVWEVTLLFLWRRSNFLNSNINIRLKEETLHALNVSLKNYSSWHYLKLLALNSRHAAFTKEISFHLGIISPFLKNIKVDFAKKWYFILIIYIILIILWSLYIKLQLITIFHYTYVILFIFVLEVFCVTQDNYRTDYQDCQDRREKKDNALTFMVTGPPKKCYLTFKIVCKSLNKKQYYSNDRVKV